MFDLVIEDHHTDRDLLLHILKGLKAMATDVTVLNANVAALGTDVSALSTKVDALVAAHTDPASQAAVDAAATAVGSVDAAVKDLSAKVDAALTPPAPPVEAPAAA